MFIMIISKYILSCSQCNMHSHTFDTYCDICRRRQLPILIQDELERPIVQSTQTQALDTSGEV